MKTPDEIKKGLECCISHFMESCRACPYAHVIGCARESTKDALAYIEQLEKDNDTHWNNLIEKAVQRINRDSIPRWISVKERLPETQVDVLLFVKHDNRGTNFIAVGSRAHWTPNRYYIGAVATAINANRVTHWMPLPDAPKEE